MSATDLRWLKAAEHIREYERFDEVTGEREAIWLMKSGTSPEARFYGVGRGQVGRRHPSVLAAMVWAYWYGYLGVCERPEDVFLEIATRAEIQAGGAPDDRHGSAA